MSIPNLEKVADRNYRREMAMSMLATTFLTQAEIAKKCGVSVGLVSVWKRGEKVPGKRKFLMLYSLHHGTAPAIPSGEAKEDEALTMRDILREMLKQQSKIARLEMRVELLEGKKDMGADTGEVGHG